MNDTVRIVDYSLGIVVYFTLLNTFIDTRDEKGVVGPFTKYSTTIKLERVLFFRLFTNNGESYLLPVFTRTLVPVTRRD